MLDSFVINSEVLEVTVLMDSGVIRLMQKGGYSYVSVSIDELSKVLDSVKTAYDILEALK